MTIPITNDADTLDSRDIDARIEELEALLEGSYWDGDEEPRRFSEDGQVDLTEEAEELACLREFRYLTEPFCPDWRHGVTLIRDSCFERYAEELAEALKTDYQCCDFDNIIYWYR